MRRLRASPRSWSRIGAGETSASRPQSSRSAGARCRRSSRAQSSAPSSNCMRRSRASRAGATRRPGYTQHIRKISKVLPEARFIHLIRDGRDVTLSRTKTLALKDVPITKSARRWKKRLKRAQRQGSKVEHYLELRYETLVSEPEATLRQICEFIELPWDDAILSPPRALGAAPVRARSRHPCDGRAPAALGREPNGPARADHQARRHRGDRQMADADVARRTWPSSRASPVTYSSSSATSPRPLRAPQRSDPAARPRRRPPEVGHQPDAAGS